MLQGDHLIPFFPLPIERSQTIGSAAVSIVGAHRPPMHAVFWRLALLLLLGSGEAAPKRKRSPRTPPPNAPIPPTVSNVATSSKASTAGQDPSHTQSQIEDCSLSKGPWDGHPSHPRVCGTAVSVPDNPSSLSGTAIPVPVQSLKPLGTAVPVPGSPSTTHRGQMGNIYR